MSIPSQRIIGLGGAGGKIANAVARVTAGRLAAAAVDTDFAAVSQLAACQQVRLGELRFRGLGAGGDVAAARMAALEDPEPLRRRLEGVALVVVVAGLGRGTGSGVLPVLLDMAAESNVRTIVVAVTPFAIEGAEILRRAGAAQRAVAEKGDLRLLVSNDDLVAQTPDAPVPEAFASATETLSAAMTLFWRLTAHPGYLHLDPGALLSLCVAGRGPVDFAVGRAQGPDRLQTALEAVLGTRGLGLSRHADEARAALVGVIGGRDLRLSEVGDAVHGVAGQLGPDVPVRLSTVLEPEAEGSLALVVLFFRNWSGEDAPPAAPAAAAPAAAQPRFSAEDPTLGAAGENLDEPTYRRRHLHVDTN